MWITNTVEWMKASQRRRDIVSLLVLTLLWGLFFWRALTPREVDRVSLPEGDFSGQFMAFGGYQASRLLAGEMPLWNPYNYAGHPFLADTQAAVLYPPRLATIFISQFIGGWSYDILTGEVLAHYLLASYLTYIFLRTITGSSTAGIVGALTFAYGGYLTGYPMLQVAVLESGIWLPLGLYGIHQASNERTWSLKWLLFSSVALALALLAGHPQTCLFLTYVLVAYILYRAKAQRLNWYSTIIALSVAIGLGYGLASVQLIPGLEFLMHTTRANIGFDALAGGFPMTDLIGAIIPGVFTTWSPLYSGIIALILTGIAMWRRAESSLFWLGCALVALGISWGANTVLYHITYLTIPGANLFRGQERLAYVIAWSIAVLSGLGIKQLQNGFVDLRQLARVVGKLCIASTILALEVMLLGWFNPYVNFFTLQIRIYFVAILLLLMWVIVTRLNPVTHKLSWTLAMIGIIVFDLFSASTGTNWQHAPATQRQLYSSLVATVQADRSLFRVDGKIGLGGNLGTMIGMQDMRGISPLRLQALSDYDRLPQYRVHQLLAVKYVMTDWQQLEVKSTIRSETDMWGLHLFLHEIVEPHPRAWLVHNTMITESQDQTLGWLSDPSFDPYSTVILRSAPPDLFAPSPASDSTITIVLYKPEYIKILATTASPGIMVISELDYPGWVASLDGIPVEIIKADGALRAVLIPSGNHIVEMKYQPVSVIVGALLSLISAAVALVILFNSRYPL
jgi:hypothetical protein